MPRHGPDASRGDGAGRLEVEIVLDTDDTRAPGVDRSSSSSGAVSSAGAGGTVAVDTETFDRLVSDLPRESGELVPLREERDAFVSRVVLEKRRGAIRVASYIIPKRS